MHPLAKLAHVVNNQKGSQLALQALATAILRALPPEVLASALAQWDMEKEVAKTVLLNSQAPDDVIEGFDTIASAVDALRIDQG